MLLPRGDVGGGGYDPTTHEKSNLNSTLNKSNLINFLVAFHANGMNEAILFVVIKGSSS
jgi:hypothetical protein